MQSPDCDSVVEISCAIVKYTKSSRDFCSSASSRCSGCSRDAPSRAADDHLTSVRDGAGTQDGRGQQVPFRPNQRAARWPPLAGLREDGRYPFFEEVDLVEAVARFEDDTPLGESDEHSHGLDGARGSKRQLPQEERPLGMHGRNGSRIHRPLKSAPNHCQNAFDETTGMRVSDPVAEWFRPMRPFGRASRCDRSRRRGSATASEEAARILSCSTGEWRSLVVLSGNTTGRLRVIRGRRPPPRPTRTEDHLDRSAGSRADRHRPLRTCYPDRLATNEGLCLEPADASDA